MDPNEIVEELDFGNGMKVANFGCGTGYFAIPIAKKISPSGILYALDVRKEKIEVVESRSRIEGISNIVTKNVNLEIKEGSGIKKGSVDWVIMINMLFQNSNKDSIFSEAKRILKKKGKILLIEWKEGDLPIGPDRKIKISKKQMIGMVGENGLKVKREVEASSFHYGLVLER